MKRVSHYMFLLSMITLLLSSCAPYKMKAIRAKRDHRYDLSINYSLKHLKSHQQDQSVIDILNKSAHGYFEDLQKQINHYEKLNRWEQVVKLASEGHRTLSNITNVVGVEFPTNNELDFLKSKMEQSKFNRADELYSEGLKFYQSKDFELALEKFQECASYLPHFKDTDRYLNDVSQKLAGQNYQKAMDFLNQNNLENALSAFEATAGHDPNFLDVQDKMNHIKFQLAESHLEKGRNALQAGNYKNAYKEIETSIGYNSDSPEANELYNKVKTKLTARLAIFPFSTKKLDNKFGAIISDKILTNAMPIKNEFIKFLERENLQRIFEEQALSQTGVISEETAVEVGKMGGVNTIVVGNVTLISHHDSYPTKRKRTGTYKQRYKDPKGVQREKELSFEYSEFETERDVRVNLSYRLISVETGDILFNESISKDASDKAQWITCPSKYVKHLSSSESKKLKASKETKSMETLIDEAIDALSQEAASNIIKKVSPF